MIDYAAELNEEQLRVVRHPGGPCVVLAGAGSGKTRTIVYRVAWLIEHGADPGEILLLTFTNKAATEMMQRIHELLGPKLGFGRIWGGTFHSIANRLLRANAELCGFTPGFSILDEDDSRSLMKAAVKECGFDVKDKAFPSPAVVQQMLSYSRNALVPFEDAVKKQHPKFERLLPSMSQILDSYARKKKMANAMDFDDLLMHFNALLIREPGVRERLWQTFRNVLVDEYQDTNALQAAIVRQLAGPNRNVIAVGDDAQSIYSFRAAEVRNILDFETHFPGANIYRLETNYRSTPEILDLANDVISRNARQFKKELRSVRTTGPKPLLVPAPTVSREAEFIVDEIEKLRRQGTPNKEIAVLFRATHHSQQLEFALSRRGHTYDYRGGLRYFDRSHVKDALAFLRIFVNFTDEAAWRRVLAMQNGIGDVAATKIFAAISAAGSIDAAVDAPPELIAGTRALRGWTALRNILVALRREKSPGEIIGGLLKTPYVDYLEAEFPNWGDRVGDIEELVSFAGRYATAQDFLAEVTLNDVAARESGTDAGPRIVLSTIHQAKGLEWDAVFVIHLTDSGFPNKRAVGEEGGLEEERRLFYVAVTRAKSRLYLTYHTIANDDSFGVERPSMFLREAELSCLDRSLVRDDSSVHFEGADGGYEDEAITVGADGEMRKVAARMELLRGSWSEE